MKKSILIILLIFTPLLSFSPDSDTAEAQKTSNSFTVQRNILYVGTHILTLDVFYERLFLSKINSDSLPAAA